MKTNQNRTNSLRHSLRLCLYVLFFAFASCKSCKKELTTADLIAQLPPETQTGANTFGCLIDGVPFVPTGTGSFTYPDYPVIGGYRKASPPIFYNSTNVYIAAFKPYNNFSLYIRNVDQVGMYNLNFNTASFPGPVYPQNHGSYVTSADAMPEIEYITTTVYTGQVEITRADTVNRIVAGRFSFKAVNKATGKTVEITNGRFDVGKR